MSKVPFFTVKYPNQHQKLKNWLAAIPFTSFERRGRDKRAYPLVFLKREDEVVGIIAMEGETFYQQVQECIEAPKPDRLFNMKRGTKIEVEFKNNKPVFRRERPSIHARLF